MIFDRRRSKKDAAVQPKKPSRRELAAQVDGTRLALSQFIAAKPGVQAWVEEATGFNKTSLLLVAGDGEWTRKVVPSEDWARDFAERAHITCFTAGIDAYPQRMRIWDAAHRPHKETNNG